MRQQRCDSDTHRHDDVGPLHTERIAESLKDSIRNLFGLRRFVVEQHCELVSAKSRDRVGRPQARLESCSDLYQQPVACGVTKAVVHCLEVVEVDEQNSGSSTAANCSLKRMLHAVPEQHTIRKIGERVVKRLMSKLLLELLALCDVVKDGENSCTSVVSDRHRRHLDIEYPRIVHATELALACRRTCRGAHE